MNIRRVLALGVVTCVSFCGAALAATTEDDDPAVQEIIALEEQWVHAENTKDADTLRTILDERCIVVSDNGIRSRDEFIASATSGPFDPTQTQTLTDRKVLVHGDTAVSTVIDTFRGTRDGKPIEWIFRCTTTYVRRDGRWRAIAEVFTNANPPQ